jgi:hypothetical protein
MIEKFLLGAYANIAFDGVNGCLKHIAFRHNIKIGEKESVVEAILGKGVVINGLEDECKRCFPFLEAFNDCIDSEKQINWNEIYKAVLMNLVENLETIRNFNTHFLHKELPYKTALIGEKEFSFEEILIKIFDKSKELVSKRFLTDVNLADLNGRITIYLICLFLNRKNANLFLKQISGFKRSDTLYYRIKFEVFTVMSMKAPVEKIISTPKSNDTLAMDMISEVSKVPIELFSKLSPENQDKYRFFDDEVADDLIGNSRIRHQSRFESLSLRYLSTLEEFKNIGFYAYFGNYYSKCYSKTLVDSSTEPRFITAPVVGFTNDISMDVTAKLIANFRCPITKLSDLNGDACGNVPFIAAAEPHYIINENNIGIKILRDGPVFSSVKEGKVSNTQPDFWMSKYELVNLVFYVLILKSKNIKINIEKLLSAPFSTSKQFSHKESADILMLRRVEKELIWTRTKLAQIEREADDKNSASGNSNYCALRNGKLASILIRDMLKLQPSKNEGKDKVTGANCQAIQRSMAYYSQCRNSLTSIFKLSGLIFSDNPHPFLDKVDPMTHFTLLDFYRAYMTCRVNYYDKIRKKLVIGKKVEPYEFRNLLKKNTALSPLLDNSRPIYLDRNRISDSLKNFFRQPEFKGCNVAKIIRMTYEKLGLQEFYSERRCYPFLDKLEKSEFSRYLTSEERSAILIKYKPKCIPVEKANEIKEKKDTLFRKNYQRVYDDESIIRLREVQDILLLVMAKKLLAVVKIDKKGNKILGVADSDLTLIDIDKFLSKNTTFFLSINPNLIVKATCKYRDYGKLFSVIKDSRIDSLVTMRSSLALDKEVIYNGESNNYSLIKEFDDYDSERLKVVSKCHEFEKKVVNKLTLTISSNENYIDFSTIFQSFRDAFPASSSITYIELITSIRNMFLHGSYIMKAPFLDKDALKSSTLAKEISKFFINILDECIKILDNENLYNSENK